MLAEKEEAIYRSHWPQALLLVLPRPGETAIGYARWVAFLAIQQREDRAFKDICDISISGFLRDRGASVLVKNDWMMDGSLALQKVVLLNLVRLQELGIAYCPVMRWLKRLEERGGAEEVRRECRVAARLYGGAAGDVRRLVLGGEEAMRKLPETQKSVLRALLSWLAASLRSISSFGSVDGHGDWNDGATEVAVPGEGKLRLALRIVQDWLSKLPKLPAEAAVSTVEQCPTVSDETPKAEGPARAVPLEPVAARPKRFLDFLGRSPSQKPQSKFLDFLKRSEKVTLIESLLQDGQEDIQKSDEEIRVTAAGSVSAYVSRAATVFNELNKPYVIVQATGNALTKAVTAAEAGLMRRKIMGIR
eukprot:s3466_g5.t1